MRLKARERAFDDTHGVAQFDAYAYPDRTESDLQVGSEYVAMGLGFWENKVWVEIATLGGFLISVPLDEFDVVHASVSVYWSLRILPDQSVLLWPEEFYREAFQADLADGEPDAVRDFKRVRALIESEDRGDLRLHR